MKTTIGGDPLGGSENSRPVFPALPAGHCGNRQKVRQLSIYHFLQHSIGPGGFQGMRQRYLSRGLECHSTQKARVFRSIPWKNDPVHLHRPLAEAHRQAAGRRGDPALFGGTAGVYCGGRPRAGTGPAGAGPGVP